MKALTLTQPWATAVMLGVKSWETRGWPTKYRGPLAIHAAKGWTAADRDRFIEEAENDPRWPPVLPLGCVIGTCRLAECYPAALIARRLNEEERSWGNFSAGRFAFGLVDVVTLAEPVPARGMLGLWEWTP